MVEFAMGGALVGHLQSGTHTTNRRVAWRRGNQGPDHRTFDRNVRDADLRVRAYGECAPRPCPRHTAYAAAGHSNPLCCGCRRSDFDTSVFCSAGMASLICDRLYDQLSFPHGADPLDTAADLAEN